MTATAGYDRELEWNEPPSPDERLYARWTVVRAAGAPAPAWQPLLRIGDLDLHLAPPGTAADAASIYAEPLIAEKRGRRGGGDYVGVDGRVRLSIPADGDPVTGPIGPCPPPLNRLPWPPLAPPRRLPSAIRVAVVDVCFENLIALRGLARSGAAVDGPYLVGLPGEHDGSRGDAHQQARPPSSFIAAAPGHGTCMAGVLLAEAAGARLGLFRIPSVAGAARPYLAPTDLAVAVAAAVATWRADVVLVAMSDGAWGTPRHLRDVLRAAARSGRGGKGAALYCSVGDPSSNHVRRHDSASLGADDLASQPWVDAVAACDRDGRWYRVYPEYARGAGVTYNRFGPAVALAASGEPRAYGGRVAADDSSQASALAAAAAATVLAANPELTARELRALLAITARVPPIVDGGRGLAANLFDGRDRLGHNLKIGYGVVDPRAGCVAATDPLGLALLATRAVPDDRASGDPDAPGAALAMAESLHVAIVAAAVAPDGGWARDYLKAAPRASRAYLASPAVQEALGWLARHLRALGESARCGALGWWATPQDHGALVERIRHAAETVREALAGDDPAAAWARDVERAITNAADDGGALGAAVHAFLATAVAPVMSEAGSMPRADDGRRGGQS